MGDSPTTLVEMLQSTAERDDGAHGIRFYDTPDHSDVLGYAELAAKSRELGAAVAARGLEPGDPIVLAIEPGLEFIELTFGALTAGLIVAPAPVAGFGTTVTTGRIAGMVAVAGARAVVMTEAMLSGLGEDAADGFGAPVITTSELRAVRNESWGPPEIAPEAVAGLMFTSGSTGEPKGVIVTHASMVASCESIMRFTGTTAESVYVGWAPFHHAMGFVLHVLYPVFRGGETVLTATAQFQRRPVFWLQLMSRHRATFSVAGNFAFDLCTQLTTDEQLAELDLSGLTSLMTGSEPVRTDTVHRFVERFAPAGVRLDMITPVYGITETMLVTGKAPGADLFITDVDADALELGTFSEPGEGRAVEVVSCGVADPYSNAVVVDPELGIPLPEGQVGEIWFTAPWISPGYWKNPAATAEVFGARLPGDDRGYFRTGDLGAFYRGELFITGRVKELIIIRGRNIYPQDLEAAASRVHPAVGIGAAFELADHPSDVGIVLEFDPDHLPPGRGLDALSRDVRLALIKEFSLPSLAVAFLEAGGVPRTATGKVRRALSRSMIESGEFEPAFAEGFAFRT